MAERKRARTKSGTFIADDPSTPENEAYHSVDGLALRPTVRKSIRVQELVPEA